MNVSYDDMIHELASAQVGEFVGGPLLSMAFFDAVAKLKELLPETIQERHRGLKIIDAMPPATQQDIVWKGQDDSDGTDDEVLTVCKQEALQYI